MKELKIPIIYEDNDILAINKPAGLLVHNVSSFIRQSADQVSSVVDWLLKHYPKIKNVGDEPKLRPGIVHRLDKDTSGVLLIAKNQKAFEYLKRQFQERKIKKKYLAFVCGKLNPPAGGESGIIDLPIGKSKKDFRKKSCLAGRQAVRGKLAGKIREAITEYRVIKTFSVKHRAFDKVDNYTLVEAYPKTGRTHQIRAHFKAIGHPIACDKLYGPKKQICPFGLTRHFLHAGSLEFNLPSGGRIELEADLPEELSRIIAK